IESSIRSSVKEFLGRMWLDISNPKLILYIDNEKRGIISTNRAGYKVILASIPGIKEINGKKALVVPLRTTGSLKKAKKLL
ncbi:Rpp14/Pop5 family protein, partial [Acidianus sp. RZ1]